jgi:hypothetical protein
MLRILTLKKLIAPVLILTVMLASCNKKETNTEVPLGNVSLQFVNGSYNTGDIEVYFNKVKISTAPLPYKAHSDFYTTNNVGTISFFKANLATEISSTSLGVFPGTSLTCFVNTRANGSSYILGVDNAHEAPETGKAQVKFVHLNSFRTGKITVRTNSDALITDSLNFNGISKYYQVQPATEFKITAVGSPETTNTSNINLAAGKSYIIWFSGASIDEFTYQVIQQKD